MLRFLDQLPELHLPGLGSFYRVETPARVDLEAKSVYPPSRKNRFEYDEEVDASLFEGFLEYQTGKPRKFCRQAVRSFVNDLLLRLKKDGSVSYPHFGTFKTDAQSNIRFLSDPAYENARYMAFRPVSLQIYMPGEPEQEHPSSTQHDQPAISTAPVETVETGSGTSPVDHQPAQIIHQAGDAVATSVEDTRETGVSTADQNGQPNTAGRSGTGKKIPVWPWYYGSILLLLLVMALLFLYDGVPAPFFDSQEVVGEVVDPEPGNVLEGRVDTPFSQGPVENRTEAGGTTEAGLPPATDEGQSSGAGSEEASVDDHPEAPSGIADPYAMADCMVVVGAFREKMNVTRMQARLEDMGYMPHLMEKGSLTLVGVKRPCRTAELRSVLYMLRNEIEGGSWVLRIAGSPPPE